MKITNIFKVGALLLAVGMFAGCADVAGTGDTEGNKWDTTMTIDATSSNKDKPFVSTENKYRRFFKQLGSSEGVAEIKTGAVLEVIKPFSKDSLCS